jgi:hypothetical protein
MALGHFGQKTRKCRHLQCFLCCSSLRNNAVSHENNSVRNYSLKRDLNKALRAVNLKGPNLEHGIEEVEGHGLRVGLLHHPDRVPHSPLAPIYFQWYRATSGQNFLINNFLD